MKIVYNYEDIEKGIDTLINSNENILLIKGDISKVIEYLPNNILDMAVTSPPYWSQRKYDNGDGLGNESSYEEYVEKLVNIFSILKNKLNKEGSFWLNLGDTYNNKQLVGIPWRVALKMQDDGWILRNSVIWDKVKGNPCNAKDKLRNMYEFIFHFVKSTKYYYDVDAIRNEPPKPYYRDGKIVTATGVSGTKYRQQILTSTNLTSDEKKNALFDLELALKKVECGDLPDFRMIIRGQQRITHSDSEEYSGRAKELKKKGYYILPYNKMGTKPGDVWKIIPEDEWRSDGHFAVYPIELCDIPIKSTSHVNGIVFDPFLGTGTTALKSLELKRKFIGVDINESYIKTAIERINNYKPTVKQTKLLGNGNHE